MRKMRNFKTLTALALSASMVMGGAMNVLAAESGDAGPVVMESDGSYEGGEMQYPALRVTLPTVAKADYDYIADPNGLIADTANASGDAAKYADSQFQGDKGIYFLTTAKDASNPKNIYTDKSAAKTVVNENAQDIDVTVKLEQGSKAGDSDIAYAANSTFTGKDKELYLAVTDGADKTAALSSNSEGAVVKAKVNGKKENYEPKYNSTDGYGYQKKASGLVAWDDCSFYLTGALNTAATWGDNVKFPSIKVTWSYEEAAADVVPSIATKSYTVTAGQSFDIAVDLGQGAQEATGIASIYNSVSKANVATSCYSYAGGKLTFTSAFTTWFKNKGATSATLTITFNNTDQTKEIINLTIK